MDNDMQGMRDRIFSLLRTKKVTITDLVNGDDAQRNKISRQLNGSVGVQLSTIMLILSKLPDTSVEWLIRGIGSMELEGHLAPKIINHDCAIANGANSTASTGHVNGSDDASRIQYMNSVIAMKDDAIRQRDKVIDELRSDKHTLNHQLSCLLIKIKKQ